MRFLSVKHVALLLFALASVAVNTSAFAIKNQVCPNCTPSQFESAARAAGLGTIYVWNPHGGEIRKFVTYCGSANRNAGAVKTIGSGIAPNSVCGATALTTEEHPVEPAYADVTPHLGTVWVATGGSWSLNHDGAGAKSARGLRVNLTGMAIPRYYPQSPTVVDYMTDRNLRSWVQDYISQHGLSGATSGLRAAFDYLMGHVDAAFNFTQGIQIVYEVQFQDGSSIVMQQSLNQPADYRADSARDSTGQSVPEGNSPANAGRWDFDPTTQSYARSQFLELMGRYDVQITTLDPHGYRIQCTWDGRTLHCVVRS